MLCQKCWSEISPAAQVCPGCGFADPTIPVSRLRQRIVYAFDATPGSGLVRKLLGKENVYAVRERLARKYLHGSGVEFGALNAPLKVPSWVSVAYADIPENDEYIALAERQYGHATAPTIFANIETMECIADDSLDFVIANQVLEHVENPLRALRSISRALRGDGIAFISLPDKRFSFDRKRENTPLEHFIRDYETGPDWGRVETYKDWVGNAEGLTGQEKDDRVRNMLAERANIHFHVWDFDSMSIFFSYASSVPEIGLSIIHSEQNRGEGIWILQKPRLP